MSIDRNAVAGASCVADVLDTYDAAGQRIEQITARRAQRKGPAPPLYLEESVRLNKQHIVELVNLGKSRFGDTFEQGDEQVRNRLMQITIAMQKQLINGLPQGYEDNDYFDFRGYGDALDTGREALTVLNEYIHRKKIEEVERATAAMRPLNPPGRATTKIGGKELQQDRLAPRAYTMPTQLQQTPSPPAQEASRKKSSFFRKSPKVVESPPSRPAPSPLQPDKDSLRPLSDSTLASNGSRTSSISGSSFDSFSITSHGECCESAHLLRDANIKKSFRPEPNLAGGGFVFKCRKCTFQLPAVKDRKGNLCIDKSPKAWKEKLQYTPVFLAKSHMPITRVLLLHEQNTQAKYRCLVCLLASQRSAIFSGRDALLEHVLEHAGDLLGGIPLDGPRSFNNDGVTISDDFDVSLPKRQPSVAMPVPNQSGAEDPIVAEEIHPRTQSLPENPAQPVQSSNMGLSIILVPGSFVSLSHYSRIVSEISAQGLTVHALRLPSAGKGLSTTRNNDATSIAAEAKQLVDKGKAVILLGHPYGGVPATQSLEGLGIEVRNPQGKPGGVVSLNYINWLIPSIGQSTADQPADISQEGPGHMHHHPPAVYADIRLHQPPARIPERRPRRG